MADDIPRTPLDTRLAEIRKRLEAATPGPWQWDPSGMDANCCGGGQCIDDGHGWPNLHAVVISDQDAKFIANAPQDIAYLLSEVGRLGGAV